MDRHVSCEGLFLCMDHAANRADEAFLIRIWSLRNNYRQTEKLPARGRQFFVYKRIFSKSGFYFFEMYEFGHAVFERRL